MTDPRGMSTEELNELGHESTPPLKLIRAKCLDCCGDSSNEVLLCTCKDCPLWPYRTGKNPFRMDHNNPKPEEQVNES